MFDPLRIGAASQRCLGLAREVAVERGARAIDTHHVLLALLRTSGPHQRLLRERGVERATIEGLLAGDVRAGQERPGTVPFTPPCQRLLEIAQELSRGQGAVGTEHLLLATMLEPHGRGGAVLRDLGLTASPPGQEPARTPLWRAGVAGVVALASLIGVTALWR